MLIWSTSYWFSSKLIFNITFSFTNNHSPHHLFVKKFVSLTLFAKKTIEVSQAQLTDPRYHTPLYAIQ